MKSDRWEKTNHVGLVDQERQTYPKCKVETLDEEVSNGIRKVPKITPKMEKLSFMTGGMSRTQEKSESKVTSCHQPE